MDFAPRQVLQPFLLLTQQNKVAHFKVWSSDVQTQLKLGFMIGLLTRKDDVAIIPLEGTEEQMLLYCPEMTNSGNDSSPEREATAQDFSTNLDCTLHAIIIKRFSFVFDLGMIFKNINNIDY